jgi:hypothetical protein
MYYTGKECAVSPYREAYEAIKSVPIVQAATAYDNRDTGETTLEMALLSDYDKKRVAMETLGLRNPLDHPSDAENINTSSWIARSMSTRRSDRRDS